MKQAWEGWCAASVTPPSPDAIKIFIINSLASSKKPQRIMVAGRRLRSVRSHHSYRSCAVAVQAVSEVTRSQRACTSGLNSSVSSAPAASLAS